MASGPNKYVVKGVIIKQTLIDSVSEVDLNRSGATEFEFPFRIDRDWFWAIFNKQLVLIQIERYGLNDECTLFEWGTNQKIIFSEK